MGYLLHNVPRAEAVAGLDGHDLRDMDLTLANKAGESKGMDRVDRTGLTCAGIAHASRRYPKSPSPCYSVLVELASIEYC